MTLMLDQRKVTGRRVIAFLVDTVLGFVIFWSLVRALGTEVDTRPGTHLTMFFNITGSQASAELAGTVYELEGASLAVVLVRPGQREKRRRHTMRLPDPASTTRRTKAPVTPVPVARRPLSPRTA